MASALQDFVQTTLQIRDQNFKKAQEATRVQLEKSRLQLEQQAAQERVKQLDREFQQQSAYLDIAKNAEDRQKKAQQAREDYDKAQAGTNAKRQQETVRHNQMSEELNTAKAVLKTGTDRTKAVAGMTERLQKSGLYPDTTSAEKAAQHIFSMAEMGVNIPTISGYDQDGNPIYTPQGQEQQGGQPQLNFPGVTTPQGQQAPLVPNLLTNHLQKPQMTSPQQFMTQQSGLAGQLGIGDLISQVPQITQNKFTKADDAHLRSPLQREKDQASIDLMKSRNKLYSEDLKTRDLLNRSRIAFNNAGTAQKTEQTKENKELFKYKRDDYISRAAERAAARKHLDAETDHIRERDGYLSDNKVKLSDPNFVRHNRQEIEKGYKDSQQAARAADANIREQQKAVRLAEYMVHTPWDDGLGRPIAETKADGSPNEDYNEWLVKKRPGGLYFNNLQNEINLLNDMTKDRATARAQMWEYRKAMLTAGIGGEPTTDEGNRLRLEKGGQIKAVDHAARQERKQAAKTQQLIDKPPAHADHAPPPQSGKRRSRSGNTFEFHLK